MDQLLEDAPFPFIMQHASRISNVRKRVLSLNSILRTIQRRVDNIDRAISMGNLPGDWLLSSMASILLSFFIAFSLIQTYWIISLVVKFCSRTILFLVYKRTHVDYNDPCFLFSPFYWERKVLSYLFCVFCLFIYST